MTIDLLGKDPCPEPYRNNVPLQKSLKALQERFFEILSKEGFQMSDVKPMEMTFCPTSDDGSCMDCDARLVDRQGRKLVVSVDCVRTIKGKQGENMNSTGICAD